MISSKLALTFLILACVFGFLIHNMPDLESGFSDFIEKHPVYSSIVMFGFAICLFGTLVSGILAIWGL